MTVVVTHTTPADGTFSATGAAAWDANHALSGIGTMAEQNANNVAITGGSISGVTLPAAGSTLQIQYNNAGAIAGMSGTSWNDTNRSLTVTGATLTGSSAPVMNLSQTWNNAATTFTAFKLDVTDTASNASSLLMDLRVGGVSKAKIDKNGFLTSGVFSVSTYGVNINGTQIFQDAVRVSAATGELSISGNVIMSRRGAANLRFGAADAAAPVAQTLSVQSVVAGTTNTAGANFTITGSQGTGTGAGGSIVFQVAPAGTTGTAQNALAAALTIDSTRDATFSARVVTDTVGSASGGLNVQAFGSTRFSFGRLSNAFELRSDGSIQWSAGTTIGGTLDTILLRDAANTLAQRNGVNAQTRRLYGTYTDASNYRRLAMTMSAAGVAEIKPEGAGTGASGNVIYVSGLPTSNPGPGILWNNAGTPAIGT